ncbi:hypothetical protein Btru_041469 [Bulinus truncatus]|nr:hypothetical protein Btru_041469 [Bulinus truncatus]
MSKLEQQKKEITFEKIEEYKEQRRCLCCKQRTFQEMVTCPRCEEYSYCSEECLRKDRDTHADLCNVMGVRKGLLRYVSDGVIQQAKVLDDDGNFKEFKTDQHCEEPESVGGQTLTEKVQRKKESPNIQPEKKITAKPKSNLDNGHFGNPLNCTNEKEKSGNTFGEGWWKAPKKESKPDKIETNLANRDKSAGTGNQADALHSAAVFGASTGEQNIEASSDGVDAEPGSDAPCAGATSLEDAGKELVPCKKDKTSNDSEDRPKILEKCFYCKKESYTMLKCSRCRAGRYCNKECQKKDFPSHKKGCARVARFLSAVDKIPRSMLLQSMIGLGIPEISTSLASLDSEFLHMFVGPRYSVLVEIVEPYFHPFRHGVVVMDKDGRKTHIMFYNEVGIYYHRVSWLPLPIPLSQCLRPGNFILLLDAHWHYFLDGTVGIRIDDLDSVYFIMNN